MQQSSVELRHQASWQIVELQTANQEVIVDASCSTASTRLHAHNLQHLLIGNWMRSFYQEVIVDTTMFEVVHQRRKVGGHLLA